MQENVNYSAGLYLRLSKDDEQQGESVSIGTQRSILMDYCKDHGYAVHKVYIDDGYSGLNFDRPGFQELLEDVERGDVNMVITKDLSRLGRDYIMTGYYSEIFFLFRGKLFCECCGHPLAISRKQLMDRETDIYLCMHHYLRPDECPKTHRVYHDMLYPYVLQQIQIFAKSMKRRKVNSPISAYASIEELTPDILNEVIERIEIGHVKYKSKPGNVIQIYWKLK